MPNAQEKEAFSKRLKLAMHRASPSPIDGATQLADRMSERIADGVTPQTAHKWLTARTIPRPDKIAILADWLNVDEHWLRYGPAKTSKARSTVSASPPSQDALNLARRIQGLEPHQRYLIEELVSQFFQIATEAG